MDNITINETLRKINERLNKNKSVSDYKFTTTCYISGLNRNDFNYVISYLNILGYKPDTILRIGEMDNSLFVENKKYSADRGTYWTDYVSENNPIDNSDGSFGVDCGTNIHLFCAISALREDSCHLQYYTNGNDGWTMGVEDIKDIKFIPNDNWHKASVEELIEHFKSFN